MKTTETRPVQVFRCDDPTCGKETAHYQGCALCKKEYCMEDGGKKHFAYGIELYRYTDAGRLHSCVCKGCATANPNITVQQLMDGMMSKEPVVKRAA